MQRQAVVEEISSWAGNREDDMGFEDERTDGKDERQVLI